MKKISIILMAVAAFLSTSCKDFLSETDPNSVTSGSYYKSEEDITNSLNYAYASLKLGYYFVNSYHFTDIRSNLTYCGDSGARGGAYFQFYNFTLTEENEFIKSRYQNIYKSIGFANKLIYHLNDITWSNPETPVSYEAQARFIRALGFYTLVSEWGEVPVFDHALTSVAEIKAANHRCSKADVYQRIFDDLEFVVKSPLADRDSEADCGRVSKAAAYALWGKAALQMATDEDCASEKTALLAKAEEVLLEAWNLRGFNELKDIPFNQVWDLATQKKCKENIFQINFIAKNATLGSDFAYVYGPATETGITSRHACNGSSTTLKSVYDMYETGDVRKNYLRKTVTGGSDYYHSMKFVDLDCGTDGYGGNNWVVLRYADVALMLAEAYYWDNNAPEAKKWLNVVRKRAGLSDWNGTDLKEAIYSERMKEFIHEGHSWHDRLRQFTKDELVAYYSPLNPNFTAKDRYFPIPYDERILNPEGLPQNPGYLSE